MTYDTQIIHIIRHTDITVQYMQQEHGIVPSTPAANTHNTQQYKSYHWYLSSPFLVLSCTGSRQQFHELNPPYVATPAQEASISQPWQAADGNQTMPSGKTNLREGTNEAMLHSNTACGSPAT